MSMTKKPYTPSKFNGKPHLAAAMARPFVDGAKVQLKRYVEAQAWCKHDPIGGANQCQYELSSLFEHLATVVAYLKYCGVEDSHDQVFTDVRNHIRHDVREEFDKDETNKAARAKRLGLNPKLQMDISFLDDGVRVGSTTITNKEISGYLHGADMIVDTLLAGGKVEMDSSVDEE